MWNLFVFKQLNKTRSFDPPLLVLIITMTTTYIICGKCYVFVLFFVSCTSIYLVPHRRHWLFCNIHGRTPVVRAFPILSFYLHKKSHCLLFIFRSYTPQQISVHFRTSTDNVTLGLLTNTTSSLALYDRQKSRGINLTLFS